MINGQPVMKKSYIWMERGISRSYPARNFTANKQLNRLRDVFRDQGVDAEWVKRALLDPAGRGLFGEFTEISINGNTVTLTPTDISWDDPENFIEMDRNVLLGLTNDWQELVRAKAPEIFIYEKNGELFVSDTLPEGME
ncbi:MAG TPA: hypothetical protein VGT41_01685 [Candidatus Babeliales bacterium]|nr:hypothetical protein [Candidatus Babeliales bacterium]